MTKLVLKCDNKDFYDNLMGELEKRGFKWTSGQKPTEINMYNRDNSLDMETIYISLHDDKTLSYGWYINGLMEHLIKNNNIKIYDWKRIPSKVIDECFKEDKKPFGELKCGDFPNCLGCPFRSFSDCPIEKLDKTFNEEIERINKAFNEAKEAYEKGDK